VVFVVQHVGHLYRRIRPKLLNRDEFLPVLNHEENLGVCITITDGTKLIHILTGFDAMRFVFLVEDALFQKF
jgi:hypothetical protein